MSGLTVLLTNFRLAARTGTELYVHDLALRLLERGHNPVVYSPLLGRLARELRRESVPVVDDLSAISTPPDVIHGQQRNETMLAMLHFPDAPAVYFCHDWYSPADSPPRFPRVLRYVAVDLTCRDKLTLEHAVPEERVRVLPSFVDLSLFKPRAPLPARPTRALLFCNYAKTDAHVLAVREVCGRAGVTLDVVGEAAGEVTERPEEMLGAYDLVFAKGRSALEALAVGAAVIIYFGPRVGPLVTSRELDGLLQVNFGIRALGPRLTPEALGQAVERELARYDALDAAAVSRRVRETAGLEPAVDEIVKVYEEAVAELRAAGGPDFRAEERAAAEYIQLLHKEWSRDLTWRTRARIMRVPLLGRLARRLALITDR
jgi:glycosyl transferase family 4